VALKVGIHEGISDEEYHSDPVGKIPSLSASIAHILCSRSPAHARAAHPKLNPDYVPDEKEHYDIGTAAHAILLEGRDAVEVVEADSWRTNAAKESRAAAYAEGRVPLLTHKWEEVQRMVAATREQLALIEDMPPLFEDGTPEVTLVWKDRDGVLCRARLDWLRDDRTAIDDFKTTDRNADPETWSRALYGMGWDVKAEFYRRGLRAILGPEVDAAFRFVVQEIRPPYALSAIALSPGVRWLAEAKIEYALTVWARCLASGEWPGYPSRIAYAELPPWEEERWLLREGRS
jgi:hypothetical protein